VKQDTPYQSLKETLEVTVDKITDNQSSIVSDQVAVEEPLEIKIAYGPAKNRQQKSIAVTMRTPGLDLELAVGFLFTEAIIGQSDDVITIKYDAFKAANESKENSLLVELKATLKFDPERLNRNFYTTSSCGVCGKSSIDMVFQHSCYTLIPGKPKADQSTIYQLLETLNSQQTVFQLTGGIHAAALFSSTGVLQFLCEDVGRHNALDKLIGKALLQDDLPLSECILLVSGRASFELVQKAVMAGIPMMVAVGAPSSLAVQFAKESGLTLIGFLKKNKFNIYSNSERITTR